MEFSATMDYRIIAIGASRPDSWTRRSSHPGRKKSRDEDSGERPEDRHGIFPFGRLHEVIGGDDRQAGYRFPRADLVLDRCDLCRVSKACRTSCHSFSAWRNSARASDESVVSDATAFAIAAVLASFGSQVCTHATNWSSVQFFFPATWQSKRCAMMSLMRISRGRSRGHSQGCITTRSTHFPHMPSTRNVRRSFSGTVPTTRRKRHPLAMAAIPRAQPASVSEKYCWPGLAATTVLPRRIASLSFTGASQSQIFPRRKFGQFGRGARI